MGCGRKSITVIVEIDGICTAPAYVIPESVVITITRGKFMRAVDVPVNLGSNPVGFREIGCL